MIYSSTDLCKETVFPAVDVQAELFMTALSTRHFLYFFRVADESSSFLELPANNGSAG